MQQKKAELLAQRKAERKEKREAARQARIAKGEYIEGSQTDLGSESEGEEEAGGIDLDGDKAPEDVTV